MASLLFGLIAALSWGLHDFLVRRTSQSVHVAPLLAAVLAAGAITLAPLTLVWGDWGAMTPTAWSMAALSGAAYALGGTGLYTAFSIGPVRLVAPICGSYPVLSLGLALYEGRPVGLWEALIVAAVIVGIAMVARHPGEEADDSRRNEAILWAFIGAFGFALTFHTGQIAAREGSELPVTLVSRVVALALVGGWALQVRADLSPVRAAARIVAGMGVLDVVALSLVLAAGSFAHPEYAAVTSSVFGIVTILLAWRFLDEGLTPPQWAGVAVVFAGIATLATG